MAPLLLACKEKKYELTKLLLVNGCNVKQVDAVGNGLLHFSAANFKPSFVKHLLKTLQMNAVGQSDEGTPLHCAINSRRSDNVELLLKYGADINMIDS